MNAYQKNIIRKILTCLSVNPELQTEIYQFLIENDEIDMTEAEFAGFINLANTV
jgi:hypothetical protein